MLDNVRNLLDRDAERLLNDIRPMVRNTCSNPQESEERSRELLVEAAHVALKRAEAYDPSQSFRLWFLGIARMCLKKRFSTYIQRTFSADNIADYWETLTEAQSRDIADSVIEKDWVNQLMRQLSVEDQSILTLSIVDQLSSEEIGKHLGITAGTARMRLFRALERAQKRAVAMNRISVLGGR